MRALWPSVRAAWVTLTGTGAAASAGFALLVFAAVLASVAIPRESAGLRDTALQGVVAASQPGQRTVFGSSPAGAITDLNSQVTATDIAGVGASFRSRLTAGGVPLASDPAPWSGLTTGYVPVTGVPQPAGDGQQLELTYRTALAGHSHLVAGQLPSGGSPAGGSPSGKRAVLQAAVTTATAARFGLRVGSRIGGGPVELVITGIVAPVNAADSFWTEDHVVGTPQLTPASSAQPAYWTGAVFIGPGALPLVVSRLGTTEMIVTWTYPVALTQLTAAGVETTITRLSSSGTSVFAPDILNPVPLTVTSRVPAILSPFITGENAVNPVLELLYVSLAVLGAIVMLLGARLVAQRRAVEFTLMRARGAALYQLAWLVLRASVAIAAVAGAAGAATAIALTPGDDDVMAWWLAGIAVAVALAGPVLISVVPQRVAAPATGRTVRPMSRRGLAARRIVIEAVLVAASVGGLVVLRSQGVSSGNNGLYSSAAPVLLAIPVAVVVVRCYPPLARQLARIAGRSRGVVAFVGLTRATRTPPGTIVPSFALVLVLAMVAFPSMVSAAETRGQVAASWQQVGADAVIAAPGTEVFPSTLANQIASVPGVVSTAAAAVERGSVDSGSEVSVVYADPAQYAAVTDEAPGARFPLAAMSHDNGSAVPMVVTSALAQAGGSVPSSLDVGTSSIPVYLAGQVASIPGVTPDAVLLPVSSLGPRPPAPNLILVAGPSLDAARLRAVVHSALPDAIVTTRAAALAALTSSPVPRAAQTALEQGTAAAAGFGVLVLLLSLLLTAATREMTLSRLATMGLRRWQAQLLLSTETLPPVVAAAIGGVACAWLLVPLVGSQLNLAAFSGSGVATAVTVAVVPLVLSAVGLVLAALLVLAVQAVITYRRGSTRALRIAD